MYLWRANARMRLARARNESESVYFAHDLRHIFAWGSPYIVSGSNGGTDQLVCDRAAEN